MKIGGVRAELCRAQIKLDETSLSAIEVERCIDNLQEEVRKATSTRSKLEERVFEIVESAKVTLEKAMEEYKKSEAFKDEVTEGALDMFLFSFDECRKQIGFLHSELEQEKLHRVFPDD